MKFNSSEARLVSQVERIISKCIENHGVDLVLDALNMALMPDEVMLLSLDETWVEGITPTIALRFIDNLVIFKEHFDNIVQESIRQKQRQEEAIRKAQEYLDQLDAKMPFKHMLEGTQKDVQC